MLRLDYACKISLSDLQLGKDIGSGGFGVVYKGLYKGKEVAVTRWIVKNEPLQAIKDIELNFRKELDILTNHRNIVKCLGYIDEADFCIVTEYYSEGSFNDLLHEKKTKLSTMQQIQLALGIAEGMEYLHTQKNPISASGSQVAQRYVEYQR